MAKYVALLRGINVGGHKKVPMAVLKGVFENQGYKNIKTLLASGNVVFEGNKPSANAISAFLEAVFGFEINTLVLAHEQIDKIVAANPFESIKMTPDIRLYITFLNKKPVTNLKIPYSSEDKSFRIIKIEDRLVYSVLNVSKMGTTNSMQILEKEFGKKITTRNFNTVIKIASL